MTTDLIDCLPGIPSIRRGIRSLSEAPAQLTHPGVRSLLLRDVLDHCRHQDVVQHAAIELNGYTFEPEHATELWFFYTFLHMGSDIDRHGPTLADVACSGGSRRGPYLLM